MHNLQVGALLQAADDQRPDGGAPTGPIKTFPLRGIKDSPPYLHDGRLLTLDDTVEFFNLVLAVEADGGGEEGPGRVPEDALTNETGRSARPVVLISC